MGEEAVPTKSSSEPPPPLLLRGHLRLVVFDCCPGDATFEKAYNAALLSLPLRFPIRTLGAPLVYGAVAMVHGLQSAGLMRSVSELRRELNDPTAFGTQARRLYLYSKGDVMVAAEDVLTHAQEARERLGCAVEIVGFEQAAHCALIREDAKRYWDAIKKGWDASGSIQPGQSVERLYVSKL